MSAIRIEKMLTRAEFSKYLFSPKRFSFKKVVRITAQMIKYLKLQKLGCFSFTKKASFKMFVATKDEENKSKLDEIKLAGYISTIDMHNDDARKVVTDENDVGDGSPEIKTQFALSAETKPRLKCKRSFREDLKISKKVLNVPSNGSVPGDMVVADVCSEISDDDVSNALAYWYRKGSEEVKKLNKHSKHSSHSGGEGWHLVQQEPHNGWSQVHHGCWI